MANALRSNKIKHKNTMNTKAVGSRNLVIVERNKNKNNEVLLLQKIRQMIYQSNEFQINTYGIRKT